MSLDDFLEAQQGDATWDSSGKFTVDRAKAVAKLKRFSFSRQGQWALKVIQHAVSTGAQEVQVSDEGEGIDESVGLSFRYDSEEPVGDELASVFSVLQNRDRAPFSIGHLSYAVLGALKSGGRLGPITLRPSYARFSANFGGRCCNVDLLTGQVDWREATEQKWTYSMYIERDRPLFTYSLFGHPEVREIRSACSYCPIKINVNGSPVVQGDDGFLRSPLLLHVDSRCISPSVALAGDPIWIPQLQNSVPLAAQVAIPRCQTTRAGGTAGPVVRSEKGHLEAHFYKPPQGNSHSSIVPVIDGVTMEPIVLDARVRLRGGDLPFTALIACPDLRMDQSHGRVVQDDRWRAVVENVREQAANFSEALQRWIA